MADTNLFVVRGRIVKDAEMKTTESGTNYCTFSIANNKKKDETNFFSFTAFGKTAEIISEYGKKGRNVIVTGGVDQRKYTDKEGKEVTTYSFTANGVDFIPDGRGAQSAPAGKSSEPAQTPANNPDKSKSNEELPF